MQVRRNCEWSTKDLGRRRRQTKEVLRHAEIVLVVLKTLEVLLAQRGSDRRLSVFVIASLDR